MKIKVLLLLSIFHSQLINLYIDMLLIRLMRTFEKKSYEVLSSRNR